MIVGAPHKKQCIVKIGISSFDELMDEFQLVHRDMEWSGMDFGRPEFLDRTMYFTWGMRETETIIVTFDDPRPGFETCEPPDHSWERKREHTKPFQSYLYAFEIIRRPIGLTAFALSAKRYFTSVYGGSSELPPGKFPRSGFKITEPPSFSDVVYSLPRHQIISGTVRHIFSAYVLPSPQPHSAAFYRAIRKKKKHLSRLAIPLRRKLSDILTPYLFSACYSIIADYFLGA